MNTIFNSKTCMNMQYNLLKGMFIDNKEETDDYILCTSNTMDDYFWNEAYLIGKANNEIIKEVEDKLISMNRKPVFLIGRDDIDYEYNKDLLLNNNYINNDIDVYMLLDDYKDIDINIDIKVVETEEEYNDFMKVLSSAYNDSIESSNDNVYADAITDCYYKGIKNSINNGKTYHIIGYDNNIPVSVATLNINDEIGEINNVGTYQGYWNKGYGKQVLSYLIKLFKDKKGKYLLLYTEYHSKNQLYYEKQGFKELYIMEKYIKGE